MANFPSSAPSFAGFTSSNTLSADNHAAQHNLEQGEIVALANKVGTGASTPTSGMLLRGNGTGTSVWAQVNLTTDATGVLPVASGGLGQASLSNLVLPSANLANPAISGTVSGGATYTSPTLTIPTIADFTNAQHDHGDTDDGGPLASGSVLFSTLLSTIFSGQVQTQANAGTAGGTMYWVNLGGIKILWAIGAAQTTGTVALAWTFTLPAFFTTIQGIYGSTAGLTTSANQYHNIESYSTSSVLVDGRSDTNGSTQTPSILIIGT